MMADKNLDLFESILDQTGYEYISDLPYIAKQNPFVVVQAIESIVPSDYSLLQWNDALEYLIQAPAQHTVEDAYSLLHSALSNMDEIR